MKKAMSGNWRQLLSPALLVLTVLASLMST